MKFTSALLVLAILQPAGAVAKPCADTVALPAGTKAPCEGILWSMSSTRKAIACREVDVPQLESMVETCQTTSAASISYLERRAESAESALRLMPRPMSTTAIIMGSLALTVLGFLGGYTMGVMR